MVARTPGLNQITSALYEPTITKIVFRPILNDVFTIVWLDRNGSSKSS